MSDEIARRNTDTWVDVVGPVGDLAGKLSTTSFVPDSLKGQAASVAAAILYGREIGLGPMQSLQSISVIKGRPSLSSEAMRAMVLSAGHEIEWVERTNTRCVVRGRRSGSDHWTEVSVHMDDMKRMGLAGQQQYQKFPKQMLTARATSELCRLVFPDVVAGFLSDVEARDGLPGDEMAAPAAPRRTAKRARVSAPTPPRSAARGVPAVTAAPVDDPPLDDEPDVDTDTGETLDADVVEETPPPPQPATPAQLRALAAGMNACGWTDRADRLRLASAVAGRPLTSSKELTRREAGELLDALTFAQNTDDPATALTGLIQASHDDAVDGEYVDDPDPTTETP